MRGDFTITSRCMLLHAGGSGSPCVSGGFERPYSRTMKNGRTSYHIPSALHIYRDFYLFPFNKDARAAQQAVEDLLSDLLNGALKNPATYLSSNPCQ